VPQSCGVQLKSHNFTSQTLAQAHQLGFRILRRGFYWSSVEKTKGKYDFSEYDPQIRKARGLGLTVVGVLFGNNELYEDDGESGIRTEEGRQGFANSAAASAAHYEDQPVLWEVWNEPNVCTFWRKSGKHNSPEFAAEYADLVKAVAPAMVKANPDCFVMAGSVSNYWEPSCEWTESCFRQGILKTGIRGWSAHPYGVKTPEEFAIGPPADKLLTEGEWDFLKNTGAGSFELAKTDDGQPIGMLTYDFTKSRSRFIPYVLATAAVTIPEGPDAVRLSARSQVAQPLTFHVVNNVGHTY